MQKNLEDVRHAHRGEGDLRYPEAALRLGDSDAFVLAAAHLVAPVRDPLHQVNHLHISWQAHVSNTVQPVDAVQVF